MASVQYDSVEIIGSDYKIQYVRHETSPDRELNISQLGRDDGGILVGERYKQKVIEIKGWAFGTDQDDLEANIDTLNELVSRLEKNLDIDWAGSTRRYVATSSKIDWGERDHYHIYFCPFNITFVVSDGKGKATSTTLALDEEPTTITTPASDSFSLLGSAPPKPIITLEGNSWPGGVKGVEYKNTDTGEKMVVTKNALWGAAKQVVIDCLTKTVTENLASADLREIRFYGVFPNFKIGTNNIKITAGGITNQESGDAGADTLFASSSNLTATTKYLAQSFTIPYTDDTFKAIRLALSKTGSPGNLTWRIETDDGDKPSGVLADANATGTIAAGDVSGSEAYVTDYSTNLWELEANTKYWLVIYAAGVDGSNYYSVCKITYPSSFPKYAKGHYSQSTDSGTTWLESGDPGYDDDLMFAILFGGEPNTGAIKHSVEYSKTYL